MPPASLRILARVLLAVLAFAWRPCAVAQNAVMEAELPQELLADRLHAGSIFVLKLRAPWASGECHLASGALVHAVVQKVAAIPNGHTEEISFQVTAPCGDEQPEDLVVTGLLAPPKIETRLEQFPGFGSLGGTPQPPANPQTFDPSDAMRGTAQVVTSVALTVNKLPATVTLGEVWRLPRVRLALPSGRSTVSTVAVTKGQLRLPEGAVFVLQKARDGRDPLKTVSLVAGRALPPTAASVHPFVRACRPGVCSTSPAVWTPAGFGLQQPGVSVGLTGFGFRAEYDREVSGLESSTTVHFLGENEVLVTFPTHALVRRTGTERPTDERRSIRAVLLDVKTLSAERVLDWIVDDHHSYLWPAGRNLLVHEGQNLRLYGPGLAEIATVPLQAPLASLRVSPDGEHVLLGELRELHSGADHRLLVETDAHGPQEEVLWSLLDGRLRRIRTLGKSSNRVPTPVLLNDGLVELRKGQDPEWFLAAKAWEGGSEKQLGSLRSSCLPVLSDVAPDLLTVGVCDVSGDGMHTFAVREDGSPVVEQASDRRAMPLSFAGAADAPRMAMLSTRGTEAYGRGLLFRLSAIQSQAVTVAGAQDGTVIARVPLPETSPYSDGFALAPDGGTLAVVSGRNLVLYALKP